MTKSLIRFVVPCIAAALMLGAVTAASASAEACTKKAGSTHVALCIEGQKNEEHVKVNLTQAAPTATLVLPTAWPPMEWVCSKVSVEPGEFASVAKGSGGKTIQLTFRPTWSTCTTKYSGTNKKCVMPAKEAFHQQPGVFANSAGNVVVESEELLRFILENKSETELCQTIRGPHHVGGAYQCKLQEPEAEASQHELICESQGNETLIEEKPVAIKYSVKVELGSPYEKKKFSTYEY